MSPRYIVAGTLAAAASMAVVAGQEAPVFEPISSKHGHFVEQFTDDWRERWSPSAATKVDRNQEVFSYVGKWEVKESDVFPAITNDLGLVATSKAAHHAISSLFSSPFDPASEGGLVVQYEVKLQNGLECGGAYLKLLTESDEGIQAQELSDRTPYTIMFGPDRCGSTNKVHFIFRHRNPVTGEIEEKHLKTPPAPKNDKLSNLYTLIVKKNNDYEIKINGESKRKGSLLTDFDPAVNPPKEIDDESDVKPADWVDESKITDPSATKPSDWDEDAPFEIEDSTATIPEGWLEDEPAVIPDPDAQKPDEWSDEDDGDWLPPTIPNPKCLDPSIPGCGPWKAAKIPNPDYKGKWFAPKIDNPLYKGVWAPRKIANPDFYEDANPYTFTPLAGVAFEWWTMQDGILVDNIYIGSSEADAAAFAKATFDVKRPLEEALEKASKPESDNPGSSFDDITDFQTAGDFSIPQFLADPVKYSRSKVVTFVKVASKDPVSAFKTQPQTGALVGGLTATLLGMIGLLLGLLAPKPATVKKNVKKAEKVSKEKMDKARQITQDKADQLSSSSSSTSRRAGGATETKVQSTSTSMAPGVTEVKMRPVSTPVGQQE